MYAVAKILDGEISRLYKAADFEAACDIAVQLVKNIQPGGQLESFTKCDDEIIEGSETIRDSLKRLNEWVQPVAEHWWWVADFAGVSPEGIDLEDFEPDPDAVTCRVQITKFHKWNPAH